LSKIIIIIVIVSTPEKVTQSFEKSSSLASRKGQLIEEEKEAQGDSQK